MCAGENAAANLDMLERCYADGDDDDLVLEVHARFIDMDDACQPSYSSFESSLTSKLSPCQVAMTTPLAPVLISLVYSFSFFLFVGFRRAPHHLIGMSLLRYH